MVKINLLKPKWSGTMGYVALELTYSGWGKYVIARKKFPKILEALGREEGQPSSYDPGMPSYFPSGGY